MIRIINIRFLLIEIISLIPATIFGQSDDFGIWYGINTELKLVKKLDLNLSSEIRTFNNATQIDQAFIEGGLVFKFNDFLSSAGSYRFTGKLEDDSRYHIRHKWFAEMKGSLPLNDFTFSARLMLQIMKRTYIEEEDDEIPRYAGRIKFKAAYDIPKFPLNPFLSVETFTPLFEQSETLIDKERFASGFEYKMNKNNVAEISYILERYSLPETILYHVVSLKYKMKF
jgi:hypothetical protein